MGGSEEASTTNTLDSLGDFSSLSSLPPGIRQESSRNSFYIKNLQQGVDYTLWMTASTLAGEGPKGNEQPVYLESKELPQFKIFLCEESKERDLTLPPQISLSDLDCPHPSYSL